MTPNPPPTDPPPQESTKPPSGIANVFRNFGRLNRSGFSLPTSPATPGSSDGQPRTESYFGDDTHGSQELLGRLRRGPLLDRVAAAEALKTVVADFPVPLITEIWSNAQDLLSEELPGEARQAAFRLLTACIQHHTEPTALDRLRYYRTIATHDHPQDSYDQLQAMIALTHGGRDLTAFEREIVELLRKWLKSWFMAATRARQARKRDFGPTGHPLGEEFCLRELIKFITDIVKFNFQTFDETEIDHTLSDVLSICRRTTNKQDLECSIAFIEALITYGYIPPSSLQPCVEILCGCYATIRDLTESTWNAISNLCRSHMAHKCILVLLEILQRPMRRPSRQHNTNTLRGAVWFLEKLVIEDEENGLPAVQLSMVMSAFRDALSVDSVRLELEICRAIESIFATKDVVSQISFEDWAIPLEVLTRCSKRTTVRADGTSLELLGMMPVHTQRAQDKDICWEISATLFRIIDRLQQACRQPDFAQQEEVMEFFMNIHGHLPDSAAEMVINYYAIEHLCYPSCTEWMANSRRLVDVFLKSRARPSEMRVQVLSLIKDVYETIREVSDDELLHEHVMIVFEDMRQEQDPRVLEALVKITVDVVGDSNLEMFDKLINLLMDYMNLEPTPPVIPPSEASSENVTVEDVSALASRPTSGIPLVSVNGSLANIVVRGLARMFIRNMTTHAAKAVRLYEELVKVAGSSACDADARLSAMRLLFRLRTDSENRIILVEHTESDYLAGILDRTEKAPEENESPTMTSPPRSEEEASSSSRSQRSNSVSQISFPRSRMISSDRLVGTRKTPLWTYPEANPLPERPDYNASSVLTTFYDPPEDSPPQEGPSLDPKTGIRIALWMECLIPIIQQGCDWEIYSYVLVHLPSQLANKTAFRNCKAHICLLRSYVCDQLHHNRFPNPVLPIKKADIAVALIHLLTVLISFREYFGKNETEGIVKAFQLGLHSWTRTAKPCIHALTVCCYELPRSTSKFLSGILAKLSQIITSPVVSVHILEFLSALAKNSHLYSNFTEPDYRNIFGIAFRYIQHAKETANQISHRSSYQAQKSGTASDTPTVEQPDLPQYVLTLAYNVLTAWFLSLRLLDRPKYVSWITRGLVLHDQSNQVDEQSEACIDTLQRFTYSQHDPSPPTKLNITSSNVVTRNWLNGMSILTIQTATDSGTSRIIVRRPSGTSYYSVTPESKDSKTALELEWMENERQSAERDGELPSVKVLPSHMLLQLAGGTGVSEHTRPILLPDDDKTTRALDVFDLIPVVDFHKIGVVYVGAGQTHEHEILSNAMGSPDYTDFVDGLGDLITLKSTDVNTGGLDRESDLDGQFMYFWKDRTTQIAFHVTTMMPTREEDPQCTMKKRHIGNDYVNIIFNNSGLPWQFGTIPSQFNFVSIVISPEARSSFVSSRLITRGSDDTTFYRVQLCCKEGFSDISPATEPKMVSAKSLAPFVRNIALNASIYSHVFNEGGREHVSNPRHRLRSIKTLRERLGAPTSAISRVSPGSQLTTSSRRVSAMSTQTTSTDYSLRSSGILNGEGDRELETEDLLSSLDFSRYT